MTDGPKNPDDLPEEDWAMSEPEVPIDHVPEAKPVDEVAAKLYAPPDTGDLRGWDIETGDVENVATSEHAARQSEPPGFDNASAFTPPNIDFEILKPIVISEKHGEDWGIESTANDGWKMPERIFRTSDGDSKYAKSKPLINQEQISPPLEEIPENLSEIYAPPETEESVDNLVDGADSIREPLNASDVDFAELPVEESVPPAIPAEVVKSGQKRKSWLIFLWVLVIGLLLSALLVVGVFVYFYYYGQH